MVSSALEAAFRWFHVFAGIIWIGLLYFFNWVNGPFMAKLDGATKKTVVPELLPRALFWFRWGAAWTWVTGVVLLALVYYMTNNTTGEEWTKGAFIMIAVSFLAVFVYDFLWKTPLAKNVRLAFGVSYLLLAAVLYLFVTVGGFSYRGTLIHTGAMFGTIMAFNVWFRIWPAQQKIIGAIKVGNAPDGDLVKLAGLRSKHNTYLSLPLLWAMMGQHSTYFAGGNLGLTEQTWWIGWLAMITLGLHLIFQCYRKAGKVQGF